MLIKTIPLTKDEKANLSIYLHEYDERSSLKWQPEKRPAVIVVPGGYYSFISKREMDPIALNFLNRGYQVFILEYHVKDESAFPRPLKDLALSVQHVRLNAKDYGIDPNQMVICGFSAGAHLAALLGTLWDKLDLGLPMEDIKPNGLILSYGVYNLKQMMKKNEVQVQETSLGAMFKSYDPIIDPILHVDQNMVPTFIWATGEDTIIPSEQSLSFALKLKQNKVPVEVHLYRRGGHGLSTATKQSNYFLEYPINVSTWFDQACNFIDDLFGF